MRGMVKCSYMGGDMKEERKKDIIYVDSKII